MIKASIIQFAPVLGDYKTTCRKVSHFLNQCSSSQLIVLPELANSGYRFVSVAEASESSENPEKSPFIDILLQFTLKNKNIIITGFNENDGSLLYNSALMIEDGVIIGKYRKIHLFNDEKKYFQPGNLDLPVFSTKIGTLGMLVCFDWMFPEAWRIIALQGAEMICHPSNLVLPWAQEAVPTHAINNHVFVLTANRVGSERDLTFTGESVIVSEKGKILVRATKQEEQIITAEFDQELSHKKNITPGNHIFKDRRTDVYKKYPLF